MLKATPQFLGCPDKASHGPETCPTCGFVGPHDGAKEARNLNPPMQRQPLNRTNARKRDQKSLGSIRQERRAARAGHNA